MLGADELIRRRGIELPHLGRLSPLFRQACRPDAGSTVPSGYGQAVPQNGMPLQMIGALPSQGSGIPPPAPPMTLPSWS
jgi:hypothetical protein